MPQQTPPDGNLDHDWIVAAEVRVDRKVAKHANLRGSFRTNEGQRIDALETYCRACKRPWDDVADEPCSALINNEHLRGGPIGERAKRKVYDPVGIVIAGQPISRYGVDAYVGID
ncbi:hypothetical protein ABN028_19310 [Actinopolymorpha sp. B17G11]|uniref:hypothetical protein n=1 Tax=Actinopolymorpha sp. B17G11 TaxID=3160861 RepID=UPI0032E51C59